MHPFEKKSSQDDRESFGAGLRRERERRKITIASIADSTKILGALLEGLERDDVSRWPVGLYRRAFLRAYATAIGLDADATWREFAERFPEPEDAVLRPPPENNSRRGRLRLTLADRVAWFVGGPLLERLPPRLAAVAFDLAIIGSVAICCFAVLGHFWVPFSVAAVCYYGGGVLLLGNGPGVCLFAPLAEELMAEIRKPEVAQTTQPQATPGKQRSVKKVTPIKPLKFRPAPHR